MSWAKLPILTLDQTAFLKEYARYERINYRITVGEWIERLGGNAELAQELAAGWREHPYESPLRWAVGKNPKAELKKIKERAERLWGDDDEGKEESFFRMDENFRFAQSQKVKKTVSAMITLTQAQAPETLTLYRGIYGRQARLMYMEAEETGAATIFLDQVTSFTASVEIAEQFTSGEGVILRVEVPNRSLVVSPKIFYELRDEAEYVVATSGSIERRFRDIIAPGEYKEKQL